MRRRGNALRLLGLHGNKLRDTAAVSLAEALGAPSRGSSATGMSSSLLIVVLVCFAAPTRVGERLAAEAGAPTKTLPLLPY